MFKQDPQIPNFCLENLERDTFWAFDKPIAPHSCVESKVKYTKHSQYLI